MAFFSCAPLITFSIFSFSSFFIVNSSAIPTPNPCNYDPYKYFSLIHNPNGTFTRPYYPPVTPPSLNSSLTVLSKDLTINKSKGTWARIYLPRKAQTQGSKLPLVIFFHGGGFIFLTAASTPFHDFCFNMANDVEVVVASIEYRLAPEHRLPAAYEDAVEALHWIKTNKEDEWLSNLVDYSNVFLMGGSAGGNIAYNAGLSLARSHDKLSKITGLILMQPFFGGIHRTDSELRLENDRHLNLCTNDMMWKLSLPVGVNRDYGYCNPVRLEGIGQLGWRILVAGCDGDPLMDRQVGLVNLMKKEGVRVEGHFTKGDYHGVYENEPVKAKKLFGVIKSFISA